MEEIKTLLSDLTRDILYLRMLAEQNKSVADRIKYILNVKEYENENNG